MRPLVLIIFLFSSLCYSQSKFEVSPYIGFVSASSLDIDRTIGTSKTTFKDIKIDKPISFSLGVSSVYNFIPNLKAGLGLEYFKVNDINFFIPHIVAIGIFPSDKFKPYLKTELGINIAITPSSNSYKGVMYNLGGGLAYSINPKLDIFADVSYKYFDFDTHLPYIDMQVGVTDYSTLYKYKSVSSSIGINIRL